MTRIYFVRHGQSEANARGLVAGHLDVPLTPLGEQQAQETAQYLKDVPFSHIYTSPLSRAYRTAEPHLQYHGVPLTVAEGLKEFNLHAWEGVPKAQLAGKDAEFDKFASAFATATLPDGTYVPDLGPVYRDAVIELAKKHPDQTILLVTHAAMLRIMIGTVIGMDVERYENDLPFPSNASVQIMDFDGEKLSLVAFSVDGHLREKSYISINESNV